MKFTVTLSEEELKQAVREYLWTRKSISESDREMVMFRREGFPESRDPREQGVSFTASAVVKEPDKDEDF